MDQMHSMTSFQKKIVALCFFLNFNDGIDIMIVSFSSTSIINDLGLSKVEMGYVFSAALAGMTLGCFFLAPLADRLGRRYTFLLSLGIEIVGMLGIAATENYPVLLAFRFLTGLGIGGLLPTMAATAAEFSNAKYRDFNVGLVQGGWPVGAILTGFFCAWFIPAYGWQNAFLAAAFFSIIMWIMVYFYMTDAPEFIIKKEGEKGLLRVNALRAKMNLAPLKKIPQNDLNQPKTGYRSLFSKRYLRFTLWAWLAVFSGFITLYTILSWVPTIAQNSGFSFGDAAYVGVMLNLGAALGSALVGYIGNKIGLQYSILGFLLLAFGVMVAYGNLPFKSGLIFILVFFIGVFVQGGFNGVYPFLTRSYATEIRSTGIGFSVGFGRFGAILGPVLFGYLLDQGMALSRLFFVFSMPLLVMGTAVYFAQKSITARTEK